MKDKYDNATAELDLVDNFHIPVLVTHHEFHAMFVLANLTMMENPELRLGQALCNVYPFSGLHFPELYYATDEGEIDKLTEKFILAAKEGW